MSKIPIFDWSVKEMSVDVWGMTEEYPDTMVVSWDIVRLGEVRVKLSVEQARSLMEQIEDQLKEKNDEEG